MKRPISRKHLLRCGSGVLLAAGCASAATTSSAPGGAAVPGKTYRGPLFAEIREHNGAPTLFINGEPYSAFSYMTYGPKQECFAGFGQAGVDVYSFAANADSLELWGMEEVWKGPDEFDYSGEDAMYEMIIEANPNALIFPRVHAVGPKWWVESHREELVTRTDAEGNRQPLKYRDREFLLPSWASEPGMQLMEEAIRRYIEHVRSAPYAGHIIGYQICSWMVGEWMAVCVDSSPPMTERFRAFLERKYRRASALREAWGDPDVRFDTAEVPSLENHETPRSQSFYEVPKNQPLIDYWENYEEVVTEAILRLTKTAKKACKNESVIGVFFGYLLQFGSQANFHGHSAVRKLLKSPTIDFFSSPTCYHRRDVRTGSSYFMGLPETVKLHGKMWWDENDYRTYLVTPARTMKAEEVASMTEEQRRRHYRSIRGWRQWGLTDSLEESISHQQRQVANCLCRACGMWWFDMGGGWYDEPRFMDAMSRMYEAAQRSVHFDRTDTAEIAVVIDAKSFRYSPTTAQIMELLIIEQAPMLFRIGAPISFYLLEDIERAPDHKLWVFLNCFAPSKKARNAIRKKVKRGGQVALWTYAPGLFDGEQLDLEQAQDLIGITLDLRDKESPPAVAVTEAAHPLTVGLFETVYGATATIGDRVRHRRWKGERVPFDDEKGWLRPYEGILCRPTVFANDKEAKVLGYLTGAPEPGLAVKPQHDWTSVYSAAAPLPPRLLRNVARFAGVHMYLETDDVLYANESFLGISTSTGGKRTIRLPKRCDVVEAYTDQVVARSVSEFTTDIPPVSTRLYFLGDARKWQEARS